jgi:hypothetical protein
MTRGNSADIDGDEIRKNTAQRARTRCDVTNVSEIFGEIKPGVSGPSAQSVCT